MIYHNFEDVKNIEEMSFESYSQSGSMISGEVTVNPKIYMKDGGVITDITIGHESYTTWAYEKPVFKQGETVSECIARHGYKAEDIDKIVVDCFDTTGDESEVRTFIWTPESGWTEETEEV